MAHARRGSNATAPAEQRDELPPLHCTSIPNFLAARLSLPEFTVKRNIPARTISRSV